VKTLVVNLPWREMPKDAKKILPITSAPHLERQKYLRRAQKSDLTSVSELCYLQMREKHPQYILYHDLLINFRSLKIADKATNQKSYCFTLNC
jgi:hypothetical protein